MFIPVTNKSRVFLTLCLQSTAFLSLLRAIITNNLTWFSIPFLIWSQLTFHLFLITALCLSLHILSAKPGSAYCQNTPHKRVYAVFLAGTLYMSLLLEFYLIVKAHFKNQQFHKTFLVIARNVSCQAFQVLLEVKIIMG